MSHITVTLDGLEDHIERVVEAKIAAALVEREDDGWLTSDEAADYLGIARSTLHDLVGAGGAGTALRASRTHRGWRPARRFPRRSAVGASAP